MTGRPGHRQPWLVLRLPGGPGASSLPGLLPCNDHPNTWGRIGMKGSLCLFLAPSLTALGICFLPPWPLCVQRPLVQLRELSGPLPAPSPRPLMPPTFGSVLPHPAFAQPSVLRALPRLPPASSAQPCLSPRLVEVRRSAHCPWAVSPTLQLPSVLGLPKLV